MEGASLQKPRLVVAIGYAILAIGGAVDALAAGYKGVSPDGVVTLHVSTCVSFAIFGCAWWTIFGVVQTSSVAVARLRRPMRLFALGTGVLVVGELALLRYYLTSPGWEVAHLDTRFWVIVESVSLSVIGYLIVVAGFWWASRSGGRASVPHQAESDSLVVG